MQTRALRTLIKVAEVGSFARAAEQLNVTLSALSMQMKALETELNVSLFDRSVRPPRLTPLGRSVVHASADLLRREDALWELCRPNDQLVGRFRVGFVTTAAVRLLPHFLTAAQHFAPMANFEFETGLSARLQDRVVAGQIDAAVVTDADGLPSELLARVLRREPFVFAAHHSLLGQGLTGLLSGPPFFHFMPETGIGKLIAEAMATQARPATANTIVLDNLEAIMECVTEGLGFTLLPVPDVERYRTTEIGVLAAPSALERKLVFVYLKGGPIEHRSRAFCTLFRDLD